MIQWILLIIGITKAQLYDNDTLENDDSTAASRRTYQITTILDSLLKNYDAQIRPNFGGRFGVFFDSFFQCDLFSEGPTKINFDILVSSFGPIQDIDMVCISKIPQDSFLFLFNHFSHLQ